MIKTPISFKLEEFIEPSQDPIIPIYSGTLTDPLTDLNKLKLVTKPIKLAPRYFLKIYPPTLIRNDISYIPKPFKYNIPWEGVYKDEVRLTLTPTIGWGEGSCYRIEYWEWQPMVFPKSYKRPFIKHKLLKEEFWLIPDISNRFNINYSIQNNIRPSTYRTNNINLVSIGFPISLLDYPDLIEPISVISNKLPIDFTITPNISIDVSLTSHAVIQQAINYKNTIDILITTNVPINETFTITYAKSIDIKQILFKNNLFPQNLYNDQSLNNTISNILL